MDDLKLILEDLSREDLYALNKHGLPVELEQRIRMLCAGYHRLNYEEQKTIRSAVGRRTMNVVLKFVRRMATLAAKRRSNEDLELGLVALDLSGIMNVDYRDAFGYVALLRFAADRCEVDLVERATATIRDVSPRLRQMLEHVPSKPEVVEDAEGNLSFFNPWSTRSQGNAQ